LDEKLKYFLFGIVFLFIFSLAIAGCSNTWTGIKKDTKKAGEAIEDTYEKTKKKLED
jgi:predicted small secreted protein